MSAVPTAAPIPSSADISRTEKFVRERFLHPGEDAAVALAPGSPRRRALDQALAELESGAKRPSTKWRRKFSLLLGLERMLSEKEPHLVDGTILSAHQVDALSGTLAALLAAGENSNAGDDGASAIAAQEALEALSASIGLDSAAQLNGSENGSESFADEHELDEDDEDEHDEDEDANAADTDGDSDEDDELDDVELAAEEEEDEDEEEDESEEPRDWVEAEEDGEEQLGEQPEDPNADKRFWFEHATGAGKTVAALGFVEASQTGGILILTHRRNLVDQFIGELKDRGYSKRISRPLYVGEDAANGPVTVETYQWFVRNAGRISSAYTIVICDEAHTALGEKTSAAIRDWTGPIFIGMTATGALIARHVTDLFPTQTSRFDLAQAARRGVIVPLRCIRIPPGVGVRTIAKVPLRRGEVDTEFDQEELAELLDQQPFNLAAANLYKTRFNNVPGVVYAAGVKHAYNLAEAFRAEGIKAQAVSGETPKRELAEILARYERGEIDVLINAQLLAEGWNSPRATLCMHLAPTASKRIYQQRVGRVTRRHPGKEAGIVVDFVHPATKHDDPVVTLHSLLDRDVYRGGAIVVGPVRRGRGRRMRVERRVVPVCADRERRIQVLERELWRIAVENLDSEEQHGWSALAGARVAPGGWRKARAMLHFDRTGELKSTFLINAAQRNKNAQLRLRALMDIAALKDPDTFDRATDIIDSWPRDERREGVKVMLRALVERRIGRRDQANAWIWRMAEYTRDVHEEYAVQRWPETKRLLGLLVNSAGSAHARNARRLVQAARKQDRRLAAALLAAALAHTPEAEEVLRGARTRMARKPQALARELLRNFPKRRGKASRRKRRKVAGDGAQAQPEVKVTRQTGAGTSAEPNAKHADDAAGAEIETKTQPADTAAETDKPEPQCDTKSPAKPSSNGRGKATSTRRRVTKAVKEAETKDGEGQAASASGEPQADSQATQMEIDLPTTEEKEGAAAKPRARARKTAAATKKTTSAPATKSASTAAKKTPATAARKTAPTAKKTAVGAKKTATATTTTRKRKSAAASAAAEEARSDQMDLA
ncbi:MAG TPA: DEAD/DEAH box helicase family protein [Solirubrobacteraceae bacterium]